MTSASTPSPGQEKAADRAAELRRAALEYHEFPTPGKLQVTQGDGTMRTLEPQAGAVQWVASGTTHSLRNTGSAPVEIVDVELN